MIHTKESIITLLETNDLAVARAVIALTKRQTKEEQEAMETKDHNGVGFKACHANIGTSMGFGAMKYGRLTPKQIAYWRYRNAKGQMRIACYAGQLLAIANANAAAKAA